MNTRKQVLIMTVLLLITLMSLGLYGAWYPYRADDSETHFAELTAERGAFLFAQNCRLCHGNVGEGGALGGRLAAAPALDRPDLQAFKDSTATLAANVNRTATTIRVSDGTKFSEGQTILVEEERMEITDVSGNDLTVERAQGHTEAVAHTPPVPIYVFDKAILDDTSASGLKKHITNTISCGRVGTAMPAWAQSQGGTLSDEQIRQLVTLITEDRWDLVEHQINEEEAHFGDRTSARLTEPLTADDTSMAVSDVTVFTDEEALRLGEERIRVKGLPAAEASRRAAGQPAPRDRSGTLQVERGVLNTTPLDHEQGAPIYRFAEVSEPSPNQQTCGQTARPAAPAGTPETIEPFEGQTFQVVAQNIAFDVREIRAQSTGQIRIRLDNRDNGVEHNIAFYQSATNTTAPLIAGSVGLTFAGPGIDDTVFQAPPAGNYFFRCDVHPTTMTGNFIVQ
jgi:mono/diheme cytochrome c family protein